MSFDPITYSLSKPKVIALDEYEESTFSGTIALEVITLFLHGGGVIRGDYRNFWEDCKTERAIKIKLGIPSFIAAEIAPGVSAIETSNVTIVRATDGIIACVGFSFYFSATGEDVQIAEVVLNRYGDSYKGTDTSIRVFVRTA